MVFKWKKSSKLPKFRLYTSKVFHTYILTSKIVQLRWLDTVFIRCQPTVLKVMNNKENRAWKAKLVMDLSAHCFSWNKQRALTTFVPLTLTRSTSHFHYSCHDHTWLICCLSLYSQVVALIHTLFNSDQLDFTTALIIAPLNTVLNWQVEFDKWLGVDDRIEVSKKSTCE